MPLDSATFGSIARGIERHRGLILPIAAAALIAVLLVPMPPILMDILLAANITLAAVILLTTIYVESPLEFSVFPSVLLGATLGRLVLNVATTRLIITAGADGKDIAEASRSAGNVIWSFSSFVTSGSLAVGVILFVILVMIQFVVITKGASRISEVAARFVLDAMPGKQMAIDADLNAGLIDQKQAQQRRQQIGREADFYGAMDGASKFIRGEALAAVMITLVNVLGGLYVGMVQYGWDLQQTVDLFTRLTIGDGLVSQMPSLLISVSAALLISRSTARSNLGHEVVGQLTARPIVLVITAVFLGLMMLTALPKIPLLLLGSGCAGVAIAISKRRHEKHKPLTGDVPAETQDNTISVDEVVSVEPMRVEIGYRLVPLVDVVQSGDLLDRIGTLRRKIAMELGLVVPPVTIRDDMRLEANKYVVRIRGVKVAEGEVYPNRLLAVADRNSTGTLIGKETFEPTFKTPAVWISHQQRQQARMQGYAVVEPTVALMAHITEIIQNHAARLLSRQQVTAMLESLKQQSQTLVNDATERFPVHMIHKVLQNLLAERVSVRDLESILEAVCELPQEYLDAEQVTEHVRSTLASALSQQYSDERGVLHCISLDESAEDVLDSKYVSEQGTADPTQAGKVCKRVGEAIGRVKQQGKRPVILCAPQIRLSLRRMIAAGHPDVAVLGYNEVESVKVETLESVGVEG